MKSISLRLIFAVVLCQGALFAQGTAFTYQGRLIDNGTRANGNYDLRFTIYDSLSNGNVIGATLTNSSVTVSNGLFTTQLDFGANVFTNSSLWLEVGERVSGGGNFTTLSPRQQLTAAPYAIAAGTLIGNLSASQISGAISDAQLSTNVALLNGNANFSGTVAANNFSGSGSTLTNISLAGLDSHGGLTLASNSTPFLFSATLPVGYNPVSIAAADVNGDSHVDLISADYYGNTLTVLTNAGDGTFTPASTNSVGNEPAFVAATDINGDGKPDLISANYQDDSLTALTNNGDGTFTPASTNTITPLSTNGVGPLSIAVADINNDGKPDLISANYWDGSLTVLTNNGDGTFTEAANSPYDVDSILYPGYGGTESVVAADVNGDGKPDLISANEYDGTLTILTNNGDGTFTSAGIFPVGQNPLNVAAADVNGDGKLDLISADSFDNTLTVLTNDGSGGFATASINPVGNSPGFVLATNLFGEAAPDLVSVNYYDNTLTILTNSGNGTFGFSATLAVGSYPNAAAAADVNGDSRLDLISVNSGDNTLTVLTNSVGAFIFTTYFSGDGSGLTDLNATNIFGTISDSQLPYDMQLFSYLLQNVGYLPYQLLDPDVALLDGDQTFYGANTMTNPANLFTGTFNGNGSGLTNVPGAIPWQAVSGTNQIVAANQAYLLTNSAQNSLTLPDSANVGDIVTVSGVGTNWSVDYNGASAGVTWMVQTSAPTASWQSVDSSADGTKLVAVVYNGNIYTSTNSGATWTVQSSALATTWNSVASSADGTKLVAVVDGGYIFTSTDSGVTWTPLNDAPATNWSSVASSADGTKLVAAVYNGDIYTSTNSGTNWTAQTSAPAAYWQSLASSADGTKLVAVVYGGNIYTSTDSGVTWTAQANAPVTSWNSVASSADGTKLVAVVYGGNIYTSTNSGVTWTAQANAPATHWYSVASSADGTKLVAVDEYGTDYSGGYIYTSADSGITWTAQNSGKQYWESVASSSDGTKLVAVVTGAGGQIYTSGQSAQTIFTGQAGTTAQFQYIGNNQWQPLSQSVSQFTQLPANVVTNTQTGVTLSGTFSGDGSGLTNTTTAGNYVYAYDTNPQPAIGQPITFGNVAQRNGWSYTGNFICQQAGLYLIEYTGEATGNSDDTLSIIANQNDVEIAGSQASVYFPTSLGGHPIPISKSFIASFNAGDSLQLILASHLSSCGLASDSSAAGTTKPSVSLTIIRIQ